MMREITKFIALEGIDFPVFSLKLFNYINR
jgi:hypothetical protein